MKITKVLALGAFAAFVAACSDAPVTQPVSPNAVDATANGSFDFGMENAGKIKIHPTVQEAARRQSVQAGPPILYHSCNLCRVLPSPQVNAIYWGTSTIYAGGPAPGTSGPGTSDGSLIGTFMRSLGGTPFWSINNEYTDWTGARVANSLNYSRYVANNSAPPAAPTNAQIQAMLEGLLASGALTFNQQTIYAVFTGSGVNLGGGFGTQYCAYHGYFPWTGHPGKYIIYAAEPYDAQFVGACTAVNTPATNSPNGDFAADATINVLSHELEEASTDPGLNAWFDGLGQENADKCAWTFTPTFSAPNGSTANVTFSGRNYLIQRNWRIGAVPPPTSQFGCSLS